MANSSDTLKAVFAQQAQCVTDQLTESYGGRLPTWEDFKQANRDGRVRANKVVAMKAIWWEGVPRPYQVIYGMIVPWAAFLVVPLAIVLYFWPGVSGWWIVASTILAVYFFRVSKDGACEGMKACAARNEKLYELLIVRGAFLFGPSDEK